MRPVIFGPAARAEMIDAHDWYAARAPRLGDSFIAEVDAVVVRLAADALHFPVIFKDVRRARLRRFPYGLFFRIVDDEIHIVACFHGSRDPQRWQGRG